MTEPIGTELFARSTLDRHDLMRYNKIKWPQRPYELERLGRIVVAEGARSYLEIGLLAGLTFRYLGGLLPQGSRIVGVDLIDRDHLAKRTEFLRIAERALSDRGYDVHILLGDSMDPRIVEQVRALGPYDCVLIDGDHTMRYARADWKNYGSMSRIVAFHDIDADNHPTRTPTNRLTVEVQKLWRGLKTQYRHVEYIGKRPGAGIGVLWCS
jgi:cephalosporin hydroxylase